MGKIAWCLPGNPLYHANLLPHRIEDLHRERGGLPKFKHYGIPVTVSFQRSDFLTVPWICEEGCVHLMNAPYSHSFTPLMKGTWQNELEVVVGTVPVTFFPEFFPPAAEQIPTMFTLVLAENSVPCSPIIDQRVCALGDIRPEGFPDGALAVRFGGKVGILLKDTRFVQAFFLFQRYPYKGTHPKGRDCLAELIALIREIGDGPDDQLVVIAIDLESPWVGSMFGARVYDILFQEVFRQGLASVFTPLSDHLGRLADSAVEAAPPQRELTKWFSWQVQLDYLARINSFEPNNWREKNLKMLAGCSDFFAALGYKMDQKRKGIFLPGVDQEGEPVQIPISYSQSLIDVELAILRALRRYTRLSEELALLGNQGDFLVRSTLAMALREGL